MPRKVSLARRRAALLQAAAEVGRSITSILDIDELLDRAVDIICDVYGFYYAGVFLVDEAGEQAVLRSGRGEAGAAMIAEGHSLEVGGQSMIGTAVGESRALIALDVGEEPVHFKNPHLPETRSEMALPLITGGVTIGALTVQSVEEAAFSDDDITSLQAMADQLAVAINNAHLLEELKATHAELVRVKTFEAIAAATTEAIHWIGNKALPITTGVERLRQDVRSVPQAPPKLLDSMLEDLGMIDEAARMIISVKEHLIGPAREERPRPAMPADVLKDAVVSLGRDAGKVSIDVAPDLPLVRADTTQLRRALRYVLQNAVEAVAGADEARITVEVAPARDGSFVATRIADTGPGIPEGDLDRIWAAFYTTKGGDHVGLGLAATLQIVGQIDGQISGANRPEGGAVFEMLIPAYDAALPTAELTGDRSILLIDDDDAWSRFTEDALAGAGNTVTRSSDGPVDLKSFDLILLDDVLETADSAGVLDRLAGAGAAGKTVVVASGLSVERAMRLLQAGALGAVLKPYTVAALADVVG
jgi:signal transduction histidine kinase